MNRNRSMITATFLIKHAQKTWFVVKFNIFIAFAFAVDGVSC